MNAVVVDTNVGVVANKQADHATPDCVDTCIERLERLKKQGRIVLDDGYHILREYLNYLSPSGQRGAGDAFMKWVFNNRANRTRCEVVTITPRSAAADDFEEFPDDDDLAAFDRADRKFVAAARASQSQPTILNAVDTGWWTYRMALRRHGLAIDFLCPEMMPRRLC